MSNIIGIGEATNKDLIEFLEYYVDLAKSGSLTGLAIIHQVGEGVNYNLAGQLDPYMFSFMAEKIKRDVHDMAEDLYYEENFDDPED